MFKITQTTDKEQKVYDSTDYDLYSYKVYTGEQRIAIPKGDSAWVVTKNKAYVYRGGQEIDSDHLAVVIRGYQCEEKSSGFESLSNLPYINGCSSHQVFSPVRPGDPTMQLLRIPPYASEQAHHVHSTVRVVYVLSGKGKSIQGMNNETITDLNPGDILILDKMTPHHFATEEESLIVIPIHVYSSTILEKSHPMIDGTFIV